MKKNDLIKIIIGVIVLIVVVIFLVKGCSNKTLEGSWKYENADYIYTFNEDGTGKYFAVGTIMTFTYTVDKNEVSILYTGEEKPMKARFVIKGNKLIIDDSLGEDTVYIRYNQKDSK